MTSLWHIRIVFIIEVFLVVFVPLFIKYWLIGLVGRMFANGLGDLGSIPGRVIPKTLKWYLIPPCLAHSDIRYVSRVKWSNPWKGVAPFPTPRCSSYWKRGLLVALDYGCQLLFIKYHVIKFRLRWTLALRYWT